MLTTKEFFQYQLLYQPSNTEKFQIIIDTTKSNLINVSYFVNVKNVYVMKIYYLHIFVKVSIAHIIESS